jgi:hypothetical protein
MWWCHFSFLTSVHESFCFCFWIKNPRNCITIIKNSTNFKINSLSSNCFRNEYFSWIHVFMLLSKIKEWTSPKCSSQSEKSSFSLIESKLRFKKSCDILISYQLKLNFEKSLNENSTKKLNLNHQFSIKILLKKFLAISKNWFNKMETSKHDSNTKIHLFNLIIQKTWIIQYQIITIGKTRAINSISCD